MTLVETLILQVGPAIAKALLKTWLKDAPIPESIGSSLVDILKAMTTDAVAGRKAARQFEETGERIAESLTVVFEADGASIDESGRIAVAHAVAESISNVSITADLLVSRELDPSQLATHIIQAQPTAVVGLSELETELYRRTISETSQYIVDVASQLPAFTERTFATVLRQTRQLAETAEQIIAVTVQADAWGKRLGADLPQVAASQVRTR